MNPILINTNLTRPESELATVRAKMDACLNDLSI